jgi:cellulase/cellobiase CelA1
VRARATALVAALSAVALALTGLTAAAPHRPDVTSSSTAFAYQDPSLPVPARVDDLLGRMTLDDKLGQMTQVEKDALVPVSDLAAHRIGSVLSGGDSTVSPNNAQTWADTYDALQRTALGTPLAIPLIYGIDAVHGHNAVRPTVGWQGRSGAVTDGTTVLRGIRAAVSDPARVTYDRYGNGIDATYTAAVAVVGETPYAEGRGDRPGGMGLDQEDLATLSRLKASGVPVVTVLVSGRPLDIASQLSHWKALLAAWLPGTEGAGVADVLFGAYAPTGKLPMTWMRSASQQPVNDGDGKVPLFPYGYGLTYSGTDPGPTPTPTPTGAECRAQFRVASSWDGGYQAEITVRNSGSAPLTGWAVDWDLDGATVTNLWNGTLTLSQGRPTVRNTAFNGSLSPGGTTSFGFTASGDAGAPVPHCAGS